MNDSKRGERRVPDLVTCLGPVSVLPRNINVYKKVGRQTHSNGRTSITPRHRTKGHSYFPRTVKVGPGSANSPLVDPHVVSAAACPRGCLRCPHTQLVDVPGLAALALVTLTGTGNGNLATWRVISWGHVTPAPALVINMRSGLATTFVEEQI